jgi:outer membrane murein-binding lipoprotein Lpp
MNKFDVPVDILLGRYPLIKKIEDIVNKENINYSWMNDECLKSFIKHLKPHVSVSEKDWEEDNTFLELVEAVNNQIITQLNKGEENMTTVTKIVVAAGVLSLIAIALTAYRNSKNRIETSGNAKDDNSLKSKLEEKFKEVKSEVKAGFENPNSNKPQQQVNPPSQPSKKTTPIYGQYELLLIIEAKRLDKNLKPGSFSKDEAEKLISNAMFAYCFAENDSQGKNVLEAVELSKDEDINDINYESEDKVFLQLSLSAKPKIAEGKPDKLVIREAMNPSQRVEIKTLKKLLKTRSITAFHSLV